MTGIDTPLHRKENESDLQYHKRLIYGKLIDKTLSDYDYSELSNFIYGKELAPDETRKRMYGSLRTLELIDDEAIGNVTDEAILSELETKKIELQKEKQRFLDQRREFNKLVTSEGRAEHLYSALIDAANNLTESVGKVYTDIDFFTKPETEEKDAVLVFSDWHYGMTTNNIFNSYNTEVCKERVRFVTQKAIQKIQLHKCHTLHVVVLGDLIHGATHVSSRVASEEMTCDQLMQAAELLAQSIAELSEYTQRVFVHVTYGNHARTVQNKIESMHRDNMERVIRWWLNARFANTENVIVANESKYELMPINIMGNWFCAAHGDLDNVQTSPRLLATLLHKQLGIDLKYILLGDKHHRESFDELGITSMLCGSLCGADDYANDKRLYSSPSQLLLIVDKDGVDAEYRIKCQLSK